MNQNPIVIKLGGSEGVDLDAFARDAATVIRGGGRVVIVHGGSHATNTLATQLGHPPQTITSPSGHTSRRTDRRTLEIFQMACRGVMNQALVERLLREGVNAVGISGMDGRTWTGTRKDAIRSVEDGRIRLIRDDFSGSVESVDTRLIQTLLDAGFTPVISPPALSTSGDPINVDADRAAAATAIALGAQSLVLLSNVPGLLRSFPDETSLIREVKPREMESASNFAAGRMKKKVLAASDARAGGVARVTIGDARRASPVTASLAGEGTVFL
ncbi:MAG: [LysW]-aminoadipate kinase [bacterium]|nr:[LysW]-aminoadipate kinase [bacterium]